MFFLIFNNEQAAQAFRDSYNPDTVVKRKGDKAAVFVGFSLPENIPSGATVSDYGSMARDGWSPQPEQ